MDLKNYIRQIPDFPKDGINFFDISPLILDTNAWQFSIRKLSDLISPLKPNIIAGIDARGFLFASSIALQLKCGIIMIRKKNKLPGDTISQNYNLEYSSSCLEIQKNLIGNGDRIVIVDDLLASGGTLEASISLIESTGANVIAAACLIELRFLKGRKRIKTPCHTILKYKTE